MSKIEIIGRLLAKLGLLTGILLLIIGAFAIENDTAFAIRMVVIGICVSVPDLAINFVEERMIGK